MNLIRSSRRECYAFQESYQNPADHPDFLAEHESFVARLKSVIVSCGRTWDSDGESTTAADFLLASEEFTPEDRLLVVVTFFGRRISAELLFELSMLVQEFKPGYHIFIDGWVEGRKPFELVLIPDGKVLGHEAEGVELLAGLGFPDEIESQR